MQTRCYRCGFSFGVNRENLSAALAYLTVTGETYHVEHCPRCRSANKLDRAAIARFVPAPTEEELAATRAALEAASPEPAPAPPTLIPAPEAGQPAGAKKKRHRRRGGSGAAASG